MRIDNLNLNTSNGVTGLNELKSKYGGYWRYDFLDFHYLYNPYFPNEAMIKQLKEDLPDLIDFYPSSQRIVAGILSGWREEAWFCGENLIVGNGSSELIRIMNGMLEDVVIPIPCFNEYTQISHEKVKYFYARERDDFLIDVDELFQFVKRNNCRYLIINNPNNPTGQLISRMDIMRFLDIGIQVIIDEAFIDWSGMEYSCEDLIQQYDNLIIVKSLTKVTGSGGLRLGYLLTTNNEVKQYVRKNIPIWNINSIAERYLELMNENRNAFLNSIKRVLADKEVLFHELKQIKYITPIPSHGNFIFCRTTVDAGELEKVLFDRNRIMIKAGVNQEETRSNAFFRVGIRSGDDNAVLLSALKGLELE